MPLGNLTEIKHRRGKVGRRSNGAGQVRISTAMADLINDPDTLDDWDNDELRMGYRKDSAGRFRGPKPKVVARICHEELTRRLFAEAGAALRDAVLDACRILGEIARDPDTPNNDRLRAIDMILNRTLGKVPERLDLTSKGPPPFIVALKAGIVPGDSDDDVIDVEAIEEEEPPK